MFLKWYAYNDTWQTCRWSMAELGKAREGDWCGTGLERGVPYTSVANSKPTLLNHQHLRYWAEIVWGAVWQPLARTWVLGPCAKATSAAKKRRRISKNWQGWAREHRESWARNRKAGNLSASMASFHRESSPFPPASGEDKEQPDLHSLLRGEVRAHDHLPTRMIHPRRGGQHISALLLSGSPARFT